jgi:hypothetical protein
LKDDQELVLAAVKSFESGQEIFDPPSFLEGPSAHNLYSKIKKKLNDNDSDSDFPFGF